MPQVGQYVVALGQVGIVEAVFEDFFVMDSTEGGLAIVSWMDPWKLY